MIIAGLDYRTDTSIMAKEKIAIAADHAGYEMKEELKKVLESAGYEPLDMGAHSTESVDYPDYARKLAAAIQEGQAARGVLICGSGIGISIAANRNPAVRSALCMNGLMARLARQHNDANVLTLGSRLIGIETARDCLRVFLETPFEGGRHQARVDKL